MNLNKITSEKIKMNLQLLAGGEPSEPTEPTEPVEPTEPTEPVKTFTQEELDKIVQKRLAKEKKDIEAKIQAERQEAEELSRLSEKEKQQKLFEKQVKEFEETKKAFERERLLNQTSKDLASKNLPIEFSEILLGSDAEKTLENINNFEAKFNEALEKAVTERFKSPTPKTSTSKSEGISKEDFERMTYFQRIEFKEKNQSLYEEYTK